MDVLYRHARWQLLIRACPQARPTAAESVKHSDKLERWKPYTKNGLETEQTAAQHAAAAFNVVAPMVIQTMKNKNIFDPNDVRENVAGFFSANTACFNQHDSNTHMQDLVFEAIERITVLCYALKQSKSLSDSDKCDSDQILRSTLKAESPHLDRLANDLPGFKDEFWSDEISKACKTYIANSNTKGQQRELEQAAE